MAKGSGSYSTRHSRLMNSYSAARSAGDRDGMRKAKDKLTNLSSERTSVMAAGNAAQRARAVLRSGTAGIGRGAKPLTPQERKVWEDALRRHERDYARGRRRLGLG